MTTIHYQPGRRLLFVSGDRVLFVEDADVHVAEVWDAFLDGDEGMASALATVTAPWVLIDTAGGCRMKGAVHVNVNWPQGTQSLADEASVGDALASSPSSLRIGPAASPLAAYGQGLGIVEGVVLAESVSLELDRPEPAVLADPEAPADKPVAEAEEAAAEEVEEEPGLGYSANRTIIWTDPEPLLAPVTPAVEPAPEPPVRPARKPGLIDGIPGFGTPPVSAAPVVPASPPAMPLPPEPVAVPAPVIEPVVEPAIEAAIEPAVEADAEELQMTVDRSKVVAAQTDRIETVLAASCPLGHMSPAFAPQCRVCGRDITPQQPQTIARPMLGRLLLPDNESVDLDRPVIFGRAPRVLDEQGERPHLINISRYGEYLSRMHLEVSLQGWHVLARDLGSTSGTMVTLPGRPPESLRPDEPLVLEPGSIVDLAGSYVFRFEVAG